MSPQHRRVQHISLGLLILTGLAGCTVDTSFLQSKKVDYKSQAEPTAPLDVPPDLTPLPQDDRYAIPGQDKSKGTTLTQFNKNQGEDQPASAPVGNGKVLPALASKVHMEHDGAQRWLVVDAPAEQLWPVLKDFWLSNGFTLTLDDPTIGLMETDWTSNASGAPSDFFKNILGKIVDNLFSSPIKDKYRTRLERATNPNSTEIFITHKGMEEVVSKDFTGTSWQPRPEDPELENEYLKKLALRLGTAPDQANTLVAESKPGSGVAATASNPASEQIVKLPDGDEQIVMNEPFDRAWRRVGLALDRSGFTVEDRDRSNGVYFIRFTDAEGLVKKKKESFLAGLMFWKPDDKSKDTQTYRLTLTSISGKGSHVDVRDKTEHRIAPDLADRILNLIVEQLH